MSDSEMLDLVAHYRWSLYPQAGTLIPPSWAVESGTFVVFGETVREAIRNALQEQARHALGTAN